jgi:WhiB family redox-sensing transcriptional regulator
VSRLTQALPVRLLDQVPEEIRAMSEAGLRDVVATGWCAGTFSDEWYPLQERPLEPAREYARQACDGCPVRWECLELALRTREAHGVWGGTIRKDRTRILQSRARAAAQDGSESPGETELARSA